MTEVTFIVNRCHVGWSDRRVVREVWDRIAPYQRNSRRHRHVRKHAYRDALDLHHNNQALCEEFRL